MRVADLVTSAVLILLGGLVLYDARRLGTGWGTDGPMSGFFPFWLGVLTIAVSGLIVVQSTIRTQRGGFVTRQQLGPVLQVLGPAVAMVLVMQVSGLYVASALYLALYMRWVGRHSWPAIVTIAVTVPVVIFVVFETWFLVPMPKGPLEAWLGY